jgi:hypothetical protein
MARYWVGGTAAWDGTAGTKWAATSGGAGGESVPTTADDVFFDSNSSGTCTIAGGNTGAKSINCTGFTGTITHSANITVDGSITLVSGMTFNGSTSVFTLTGIGTLVTAGKQFSTVTINSPSADITLGDALNLGLFNSRNLNLTQGSLDTANYNVTCAAFNSSNSNVRSLTLGSSTISVNTVFNLATSTNLVFSSGTSQINLSGNQATFSGGGNTFHNVSFINDSVGGFRTVNQTNIFNDLSVSFNRLGAEIVFVLSADQTVNGTFTCAGTSSIRRGFVRSDVIGTTRTITAAAVSANDCDFRDITISGAAAPIAPTRAGDCGGNSGITFPAAKTVFRVGTVLTWSGSNSWALTSGGSGSNDNFPLAQDTAVIDDNTALTGTLSSAVYNIGTLDASARTIGITLSHGSQPIRYGDYTLGSGVTISGTSAQTFSGRGTQTFTSAGKTITFPITVDKPTGAFELGDAYESSNTLTLTQGTFDAKNYSVTCTRFDSSNSNTRTLTMGSGLWTLSGTGTGVTGSVWVMGTPTGLTLNKDTADILLSNTGTAAREFRASGRSFNKITIGGATGTSTTTFSLSPSFTELASIKTVAHTITFSSASFNVGTWSVTGTAGNVVTVNSSSAGTRRTINLTNATSDIDFLDVQDIGITDPDKFYVGDNSTDSGNNLNVIFTAAPSPGVLVPVTGVAATGQVGTGVAVGTAVAPVTGVATTGQVGTSAATGTAVATATGVAAAGQVGDVVVSTASVTTVLVTGVAATGAVGDVVVPDVDVSVAGAAATGAVGDVVVTGTAVATATGVAATGAVGNVLAINTVIAAATGVSATGEVGGAQAFISAQIIPFGVVAAGAVGAVEVSGTAVVPVTGVEATGQVGTAQAVPLIEVDVTGVAAVGAVGTVAASAGATGVAVGVSATGRAGQVIVWGPVSPDPGNLWTDVDPSDTTVWTPIAA